jgi:hypothetical protein
MNPMMTNVATPVSNVASRVGQLAAGVQPPATPTPKAPEMAGDSLDIKSAPKPASGMFSGLTSLFDSTGIGDKLKAAMGAKNTDEVVAAVTGGLTELAVERTGTKDLDQRLHDDYAGTIKAHVSNETTRKALLALGDVLGDKVASELVSASAGAVTGTAVRLMNDPDLRKLYADDKVAFGKQIANESGKDFLYAFATAFGTAKAEDLGGMLFNRFKDLWSKK